jgi:hypothetical protein
MRRRRHRLDGGRSPRAAHKESSLMECVLAAIFLLLLVALPLWGTGLLLWPSRGDGVLKQVAQRFGGTYHRGGWFRPSRVTLRYGAALALLRLERRGTNQWAELTITGIKPGVSLEIAPADEVGPGILKLDRKLGAVMSVPLDPARPYVAYATHKYVINPFLADVVVMQLKVLQRWGHAAPLVVTVAPSQLTVRKQWTQTLQAESLVEFVQLSLRLNDHVQLGKEQGIEFVAPVQSPLEHVKCAICGDSIGAEYVTCRACSAPHHLDCWKYNGSCGMFACKEPRYEMARNAGFPQNTRWQ